MTTPLPNTKKKVVLALIIVVLTASTSFFVVPQSAHAQWSDFLNFVPNLGDFVINTLGEVSSASSDLSNADTAASTDSLWVKEYVLDPIAWGVSQAAIQTLTGSVVKFVASGNKGAAMFVTNLSGHMQGVGDKQTSSFLVQFAKNSNSPFAAAISSSLRTNYLQGTSMAGFWAANKCTLSRSSPNVNKFLAGDWSQGGAAAWFALTTQDQNNPYTLYQNAQSQLGSNVGGAQAARTTQVNNGSGFLSWCSTDEDTDEETADDTSTATGVNPGDPCTNSDGSPGTIQTPGVVIKDQLSTSLGSGVAKEISADEMSEVLAQVALSLTRSVLGGVSGGLLGVTKPNSTGRSAINTYTTTNPQGSLNVTTLTNQTISNVGKYQKNWWTIYAAANTASTSVASLATYCTDQGKAATDRRARVGTGGEITILDGVISNNAAQVTAAQTALTTYIVPVLNQAATASSTIIAATNMVQQVQTEANSTAQSTDNGAKLAADLSTLSSMPPTNRDVAESNSKVRDMGSTISQLIKFSPAGSLNISDNSDPSVTDLMNVLSANANALKASCNLQTALDAYYATPVIPNVVI